MQGDRLQGTLRYYNQPRVRLPLTRNLGFGGVRVKSTINKAASPSDFHAVHLTEYEKHEIQGYADVYYAGQNCERKIQAPVDGGYNSGYDDERGDYTIKLYDHIAYRYEVLSTLGSGSFGQVVKVADHYKGTTVALKIIRNKRRFQSQAKIEVQILLHLRRNDPNGIYGIVQMLDSFTFRSHVCITYELLSVNLYEHLKQRNFRPISLNVVRKIAASLLVSLSYIWRENIIHCDLKPENILLKSSDRAAVKVIDFGSACFENSCIYTYIQSRFYRAPEVILGRTYTKHIDLWSYGCVICELATGVPIFPGESEQDQLACIMEYLGIPPHDLILQSPRKHELFDANADHAPKLFLNSKRKIRFPGTKSLSAFLGLPEDDGFVSFVRQFLCWIPEDRVPPRKAMRHPWIADAFEGASAPPLLQMNQAQTKMAVRAAISNAHGVTVSLWRALHLPKIVEQ
ncbi:serine/threonine-protein kinase HSL1,negative regulator of Swe1 kinase [Trypanosoma rangeli]|uniref:dual-specificity kinase n=1 Tax=Trypanosoma rangeli TaxID=5698 RepID=A0A3R7KRL6_TRYRA|nr:serine/threonine-protein kinase HSL1,negative regulator of Swe1 kinase [Trypanosoma rangeli]RNE99961.1 serine/threonine-protein kinase HSL1,negative regulator of Swe1 kinase [Trypanosoma rangeli]|eukprot:RNE99961.1 serine/threonine-protein kinase HSL1,negative regulator of Swe1 kinase [Trypanosoma rangeli]